MINLLNRNPLTIEEYRTGEIVPGQAEHVRQWIRSDEHLPEPIDLDLSLLAEGRHPGDLQTDSEPQADQEERVPDPPCGWNGGQAPDEQGALRREDHLPGAEEPHQLPVRRAEHRDVADDRAVKREPQVDDLWRERYEQRVVATGEIAKGLRSLRGIVHLVQLMTNLIAMSSDDDQSIRVRSDHVLQESERKNHGLVSMKAK